MQMKENSIRFWVRLDGTIDVTHHRQQRDGRLHDVARHYKQFQSSKEAYTYGEKLRQKLVAKKELIGEFKFDTFGFQTSCGWSTCPTTTIQAQKIGTRRLTQMSKWTEFYQSRVHSTTYEKYFREHYEVFLEIVKKEVTNAQNILEVGSGTGLVTKIVKEQGKQFFALDRDAEMLAIASSTCGTNVKLIQFNLANKLNGAFDFIHSHGVLEHFTPEKIKEVTSNLRKSCKKMVHYVPTNKYSSKSFGDELLLSTEAWKELTNPTCTIETNSGKDLILIWN